MDPPHWSIASAMDVKPGDLDLHPAFDVAPINSAKFQDSLWRDLEEIAPALVVLDPLYTYHGMTTKASDLHQEGSLLNQLSTPCMEMDASLLVVNHMNQTGQGMSLKRITMAGSGEWADSWLLLAHRDKPDVENGAFRLKLEIGSRQWGGTTWDLDLNVGRFDQDTGTHDGEISWDLRRANSAGPKSENNSSLTMEREILQVLTDQPWELTKSGIKEHAGGRRQVFGAVFSDLIQRGVIADKEIGRMEGGTMKKRTLWGLSANLGQTDDPGSLLGSF